MLFAIPAVGFGETLPLVLVTAERLDDLIASDDFLGDLGDVAYGILNPAAVTPESDSEQSHERCNDREQDGDKNRQRRTSYNFV